VAQVNKEWCWDNPRCLTPGEGCTQSRATCSMAIDCDCSDCNDSNKCGGTGPAPPTPPPSPPANPLRWTGVAEIFAYKSGTDCDPQQRTPATPVGHVISITKMGELGTEGANSQCNLEADLTGGGDDASPTTTTPRTAAAAAPLWAAVRAPHLYDNFKYTCQPDGSVTKALCSDSACGSCGAATTYAVTFNTDGACLAAAAGAASGADGEMAPPETTSSGTISRAMIDCLANPASWTGVADIFAYAPASRCAADPTPAAPVGHVIAINRLQYDRNSQCSLEADLTATAAAVAAAAAAAAPPFFAVGGGARPQQTPHSIYTSYKYTCNPGAGTVSKTACKDTACATCMGSVRTYTIAYEDDVFGACLSRAGDPSDVEMAAPRVRSSGEIGAAMAPCLVGHQQWTGVAALYAFAGGSGCAAGGQQPSPTTPVGHVISIQRMSDFSGDGNAQCALEADLTGGKTSSGSSSRGTRGGIYASFRYQCALDGKSVTKTQCEDNGCASCTGAAATLSIERAASSSSNACLSGGGGASGGAEQDFQFAEPSQTSSGAFNKALANCLAAPPPAPAPAPGGQAGLGVGLGLGIPAMAGGLWLWQKKRNERGVVSLATAHRSLVAAGTSTMEPELYSQL
jgi:hypothetical protein